MAEGLLRRGGVRRRVTVVAALALALVLTVVAVGLVVAQRIALRESLDTLLTTRTIELGRLWSDQPTAASRGGDDVVWQAVTASGEVVGSSSLLDGEPPLGTPVAPGVDVALGEPTSVTDGVVVDRLGTDARSLTWAVDTGDQRVTLFVFAATDDVDEAVGILAALLAVAVPLATAVLAWLVWVLVGRALAPVEAIRTEVAAISGAGLDRRVPVPADDDEVARLAATMNGMLDRLEESAAARRRFTADASHELRSPLTRIRAQLETAQPGDDLDALRASLAEDTAEIQRLVEDLLLLARLDEQRTPVADARIDLDEIVLEEVRRVRAHGTGPRVEVDAHGVSGAEVSGDRGALTRAVRNLLDNAVRHAETRVEVLLTERGEGVELVVVDDGPGIPPADSERVFDRFTRLDDGRSRDRGGAGLGLAIVREVVERHGGSVRVAGARPDRPGARFEVHLPASR